MAQGLGGGLTAVGGSSKEDAPGRALPLKEDDVRCKAAERGRWFRVRRQACEAAQRRPQGGLLPPERSPSSRSISEPVDEQTDHALSTTGTGVVRRHAQAGHRAEKLISVDIAADRAVGDRGLEQSAECRSQLLIEVAWQIVERRVAGMQGLGESALGSDERRVSLHPARQGIEGRERLCKHGREVRAGVHFTAEHGGDQIGALWKVPVEGSKPNVGLVGDLAHRRIDAGDREHLLGGEEQGVETALRVGAHATPRPVQRARADIMIFRLLAQNSPLENGSTIHI
jgi:hypothetical protein